MTLGGSHPGSATAPAHAPLLGSLVPPSVATVEAFDDLPDIHLFDEEIASITGAVEKRRHEFATVRHCARTALATLGIQPLPLLPGYRGAPQWPTGMVGSMTHCAGYRGAAVATATDVLAIGIDAEPDAPLPDGVLTVVARPDELERLTKLPAGIVFDRLLFSCKEAVFKAWYPLTGLELGFDEASIRFQPAERAFTAELHTDRGLDLVPRLLTGRWDVQRGLVISALVLPHP